MGYVSSHPCPICGYEGFTSLLDKGMRDAILCLRVHCTKEECNWSGKLSKLEGHLSIKCHYSELACVNGCGQVLPRHVLKSHQLYHCPQQPLQPEVHVFEKKMKQRLKHQDWENQEKLLKKEKQELLKKLENQEIKYNELQELHHQSIDQSKKLEQKLCAQQAEHKQNILESRRQLKKNARKQKKRLKKQNECLLLKLHKQKMEHKNKMKELHQQLLQFATGMLVNVVVYVVNFQ